MKYFLSILLCASVACSAGSEVPRWTDDEAMIALFQGFSAIKENSLQELSIPELAQKALKSIAAEDEWSRYLSPAEFTTFSKAEIQYAGIGAELRQSTNGLITLIPYPGGPAALAGAENDDLLVAINGTTTSTNLPEVVTLLRGATDSAVEITLRAPNAENRAINVLRGKIKAPSIIAKNEQIRILRFSPATPRELQQQLADLPPDLQIDINLRGNQGGDIYAAIDSAALFLPANTRMLTIKRRSDEQHFSTQKDGPFSDRTLLLLQDEQTASAAEVFIAALRPQPQVQTAGPNTYGKAHTQKVIPLMDGSALILTDGQLYAPDHTTWHLTGLPEKPAPTKSKFTSWLNRLTLEVTHEQNICEGKRIAR